MSAPREGARARSPGFQPGVRNPALANQTRILVPASAATAVATAAAPATTTAAAVATTAAAPAAAAATVATATTAAAPAATAALFLRTGFIDRQRPALHLAAIESGDGFLRLLVIAHLHETEPLGTAGVALDDHLSGLHAAVRCKEVLQVAVANAVRKVSDIQLLAHVGLLAWPCPIPTTPEGSVVRRRWSMRSEKRPTGWIAAAGDVAALLGCGGRLSSGWQASTSLAWSKRLTEGKSMPLARRVKSSPANPWPEDKYPWSRKGAEGPPEPSPAAFRAQLRAGRGRRRAKSPSSATSAGRPQEPSVGLATALSWGARRPLARVEPGRLPRGCPWPESAARRKSLTGSMACRYVTVSWSWIPIVWLRRGVSRTTARSPSACGSGPKSSKAPAGASRRGHRVALCRSTRRSGRRFWRETPLLSPPSWPSAASSPTSCASRARSPGPCGRRSAGGSGARPGIASRERHDPRAARAPDPRRRGHRRRRFDRRDRQPGDSGAIPGGSGIHAPLDGGGSLSPEPPRARRRHRRQHR